MTQLIQLHAVTQRSIINATEDTRAAMSKFCGGIDDMHQLGGKALVVRAEIFPKRLRELKQALELVKIELLADSIPESSSFQEDVEHPVTLQVVSLADDNDYRVEIPMVPG